MARPHPGKPRKQLDLAELNDDLRPQRTGELFERIDALLDWDRLRRELLPAYAEKGRPALDPVLLVKMMLLGYLEGISDRRLEEHCIDRTSFRRFLGLAADEFVPDHSTLTAFRRRLEAHGLAQVPLLNIEEQLAEQGFLLQPGRSVIVDGSLVRARTNKNTKDKNGEPLEPEATTQGRSDNKPPTHGYKIHAAMEEESGLIAGITGTPATGSEREELNVLCIEGDKELLADKGYAGREVDKMLRKKKVKNKVMRKKPRQKKMSEHARRRNQSIAARRAPVERVFAEMKCRHGLRRLRTMGLAKARHAFAWFATAFNLKRIGLHGAMLLRAGP